MKRLGPIVLALVGAVAACGDDGSSQLGHDAGHGSDAGIDSTPRPLTDVVITNQGATPDIYEYRDGSGDWQDVDAPDANGHSTIHVTNDFTVLALCAGDGSAVRAVAVNAAIADQAAFIDCFPPSTDSGSAAQTVPVTGTMAQGGSLSLGTETVSSTTSPWTVNVSVPTGTYDAAGFDTAHTKMLIRRGIVVSGPLAVTPAFDLTTEGAALGGSTPAVPGLIPDAQTQLLTLLFTQNAFVNLGAGSGSGELVTAPLSLVSPNDFEESEYLAFNAADEQFAIMQGQGSGANALVVPATLAMLSPITGITFSAETGTRRAHWTTTPALGDITLDVQSQTQELIAIATQNWVAATGATSLAFDTTARGFKNLWFIDTTKQFFALLSQSSVDATTNVQYGVATADPRTALALRGQVQRERIRHRRLLRARR